MAKARICQWFIRPITEETNTVLKNLLSKEDWVKINIKLEDGRVEREVPVWECPHDFINLIIQNRSGNMKFTIFVRHGNTGLADRWTFENSPRKTANVRRVESQIASRK